MLTVNARLQRHLSRYWSVWHGSHRSIYGYLVFDLENVLGTGRMMPGNEHEGRSNI
jgi:hypothetical protein